MEHYCKGEVKECPDVVKLPKLEPGAKEMIVKYGSKVKNLLGPALKHLSEQPKGQVVWRGSAKTLSKAISCAELTKKRCPHTLHQVTRIFYKRIEEYYEPRLENLERLRVVREIPAIVIILSRDQIQVTDNPCDGITTGYQTSKTPIVELCELPNVVKDTATKSREGKPRVHIVKSKRLPECRFSTVLTKTENLAPNITKTEKENQ